MVHSAESSSGVNGVIDFVAGSLGGCAIVLVGQPLDTAKVKMQTFPKLYPNMVKCVVDTFKKDGIFRGLYAGTNPALIANIAENSVLFCAYGFCQNQLISLCKATSPSKSNLLINYSTTQTQLSNENQIKLPSYSLTPLGNAVAGFYAAFFSSFSLCPTELIKCKLQAARETGNIKVTAFGLTRDILRKEGVPGLFRGLTSTMFREMPGYFFFFGGIEVTREFLKNEENVKEDLKTNIIAGAVGGVCLWTAIFPFDVCKSKIQVESSKEPMLKVMKKIVRKNGVSALYNGLWPTLLRTIPTTAALLVTYEFTKDLMTKQFNS